VQSITMAKAELRIQWFSEAGFSLRANRADWSGDAYGPPAKLKKNRISFRFRKLSHTTNCRIARNRRPKFRFSTATRQRAKSLTLMDLQLMKKSRNRGRMSGMENRWQFL
jgi:hypothetical protein